MSTTGALKTEDFYIDLDLSGFGKFVEDVIVNLVNTNMIRVEDMKFYSNTAFDNDLNTNQLADYGNPILYYFIYKNFKMKEETM